ncbi:lipase family protein [Corynebacterium sphenisci]|uniref:lipase family protein n=1 Tax=Corynebacterium sphenisci TaxID=191493 RepID=UPI0026DF8406|nr:lipase family protein [Corynebacterium sphenisci]MDO5730110.1 lipase family protein [Corynebacterium sphenisci]
MRTDDRPRPARRLRTAATALLLVLAAASPAAAVLAAAAPAPAAGSAGGTAPGGPPGRPPGTSPIPPDRDPLTPGALPPRPGEEPDASATLEVLEYPAHGAGGRAITATGSLFTPEAAWSGPGSRPLLLTPPGTLGQGDQCALSRRFAAGERPDETVRHFLNRGWAVMVPDYEGLGTPGTHTYMVRDAQGMVTLDAARAAIAAEPSLSGDSPIGVHGFSQGGGAAAAAAELAAAYAPELDIRAIYAGAVPADLAATAATLDSSLGAGFIGYAINGMAEAYPELADRVGELVTDRGREFLDRVSRECVAATIVNWAGLRSADLTRTGRSIVEVLREPGIRPLVEEQRLGRGTPTMPVLMAHNRADDVVPYAPAARLARTWAARGADVEFLTVDRDVAPGLNHGAALQDTREASHRFLVEHVTPGA